MEGHVGEVLSLCSDDSGHVWSCGWDKKIFVWDAGVSRATLFFYLFICFIFYTQTFCAKRNRIAGCQTVHHLPADAAHKVDLLVSDDVVCRGREARAEDLVLRPRRRHLPVAV